MTFSFMQNVKYFIILALFVTGTMGIFFFLYAQSRASGNSVKRPSQNTPPFSVYPAVSQNNLPAKVFSVPIDQAVFRVTKKPFGIKVSRADSPVQPERFNGFHTGVDFEITNDEQNTDVKIYAICSGVLLEKRHASGYGGVAVQKCQLDGNDITIIYGHLALVSVAAQAGDSLARGQAIGLLGKAYSVDTDGERKHLHLGIHRGDAVDIRGYVQNASELNQWIDVMKYL